MGKVKELLMVEGDETEEKTYRRLTEAPDMSTEDWNKKILQEIDDLNVKYADPNDTTCKHCLDISLNERYEELRATGYI